MLSQSIFDEPAVAGSGGLSVAAARPQARHFSPLTINVTTPIRDELQRIADREVLSQSDVVRRACLNEIERDRDEAARDDA
jgi:hypothetical protein